MPASAEDAQLAHIRRLIDESKTAPEKVRAVMDYLRAKRAFYHWVGVYVLRGDTLVLGPYAGPTTDHTRIPVGRGVCGTAVAEGRNQIIDDVRQITNYLACNLETRSEIVVLINDPSDGDIIGQIDVDGSQVAAFGKAEEAFLMQVGALIAPWLRDSAPL